MSAIEKEMMQHATLLCNKMVVLLNGVPESTFHAPYGQLNIVGLNRLFRHAQHGRGPFVLNQHFNINTAVKQNALLLWFHSAKFCNTRYGTYTGKTFVLPLYCPSCAAFHLFFAGGCLLSENNHVTWDKMEWENHSSMVGSADHVETIFAEHRGHPFWTMLENVAHRIVWIKSGGEEGAFPTKKNGVKRVQQQSEKVPPSLKKQKVQVEKVVPMEFEQGIEEERLQDVSVEFEQGNEEELLQDVSMEFEQVIETFVEEEVEMVDCIVHFQTWVILNVAPVVEETQESFLPTLDDHFNFGMDFSDNESPFVTPTIQHIPLRLPLPHLFPDETETSTMNQPLSDPTVNETTSPMNQDIANTVANETTSTEIQPLQNIFSNTIPHMQNFNTYRVYESDDDMPMMMNNDVGALLAEYNINQEDEHQFHFDSELFLHESYRDDE